MFYGWRKASSCVPASIRSRRISKAGIWEESSKIFLLRYYFWCWLFFYLLYLSVCFRLVLFFMECIFLFAFVWYFSLWSVSFCLLSLDAFLYGVYLSLSKSF